MQNYTSKQWHSGKLHKIKERRITYKQRSYQAPCPSLEIETKQAIVSSRSFYQYDTEKRVYLFGDFSTDVQAYLRKQCVGPIETDTSVIFIPSGNVPYIAFFVDDTDTLVHIVHVSGDSLVPTPLFGTLEQLWETRPTWKSWTETSNSKIYYVVCDAKQLYYPTLLVSVNERGEIVHGDYIVSKTNEPEMGDAL
jgi:hypothetical protein